MKKSIFTLALAAAMSISAYAVPNTFNYQGVCKEANAAIDVTFTVQCDGEVVYTETHEGVTTNANGAFTAVVGSKQINGAWDNIDWTAGEYVIVTSIGNETVSTAVLQAVPYANVAGSVEGLVETQQDVMDLVQANRENKTDIAELKEAVAAQDEYDRQLQETLQESFGATADELDALKAQVDGAYETLQELLGEDGALNTTLAALDAKVDNIGENAYMTGVVAQEAYDKVLDLEDVVAEVSSDVQGLQEKMRGVASVEEVAALEAKVDNIGENAYMTGVVAQEAYDKVLDLEDVVANVSSDVQGIQEKMRGLATVEALAELEAAQDQYDRDLQETLKESFDAAYELISANEEAIANVSSDVQGIQEKMRGLATVEALAELEAAQDEYDRQLQETLQESFNEAYELISANAQAIEYVTSDVQGIQETLRGKADVDQVNADLETLRRMIEDNSAAIAALSAVGK